MTADQEAERFLSELRGLPADQAPNPASVSRSLWRVKAAQRAVQQAMDRLATTVRQERHAWGFRD